MRYEKRRRNARLEGAMKGQGNVECTDNSMGYRVVGRLMS